VAAACVTVACVRVAGKPGAIGVAINERGYAGRRSHQIGDLSDMPWSSVVPNVERYGEFADGRDAARGGTRVSVRSVAPVVADK
jgi:hypothetical protein